MEIDRKSVNDDERVKLFAQGMHEMSAKYIEYTDSKVCEFLKVKGYEVDETKFGLRRLKKQLESEGKRVVIKTLNQSVKITKDGIEFSFNLKIELKEV